MIWRLLWRNLFRGRTRNALTVLGICIGVALVISINISLRTALAQMEEVAAKATGNADIVVRSCVGSSFPVETIDIVRSEGEIIDRCLKSRCPKIQGEKKSFLLQS